MMLFNYNYYDLPDRNDGSKDLKMQDGKKKFVPEFADGSTLDLEDQIEVEGDDAVNNNIMMVTTYRKSRAKGMRTTATVSVTALSMFTEWSARAAIRGSLERGDARKPL